MLKISFSLIFLLSIFFNFSVQGSSGAPADSEVLKEIFDPVYYKKTYGSSFSSKVQPLDHFTEIGWKNNFNPNNWFDIKQYLQFFPDQAATNPVVKWLKQPTGIQSDSAEEQLITSIRD